MDSILVRGGQRLKGAIPIFGAKNACLALMPAALLTDEPVTLTNAPRLSDIRTMTQLLESLGCEVASLQAGRVIVIGLRHRSSAGKFLLGSNAHDILMNAPCPVLTIRV